MSDPRDMRVPVLAGDPALAGPADRVQPMPPTGTTGPFGKDASPHAPGCTCCRPRAALAEALARLFIDRARGTIPFFERVVVPCAPGDEADLAAVLAADPVTAARYRFAGRLTAPG